MIQRIQSIFLALIAVSMITFFFVPIWDKASADGLDKVTLSAFELVYSKNGVVQQTTQTFAISLIAFVVLVVSSISLFSFRNRIRQLQLGLALSLLIASLLGIIVFYSFQGQKLIPDNDKGSFGIGLLIPAISMIFNSLANRFIRSDEEEVRSADRMR